MKRKTTSKDKIASDKQAIKVIYEGNPLEIFYNHITHPINCDIETQRLVQTLYMARNMAMKIRKEEKQ